MSKTTKRKHVTKEVTDNFVLPTPDQSIVKVLKGRGNNLHEVETSTGETYLVSMPTKFRRNVWIKRGDFVVVQPIEEGDKVKAEIFSILYKEQIRYIKQEGKWPEGFTSVESNDPASIKESESSTSASEESQSDDEDDLTPNPNRAFQNYQDSSSDSSNSSNESSSEEEGEN
nr:EOG090X0KPP [Triops cancriformis]